MIEFTSGDMFTQQFDIRVNTVNCVGVMGAGVALAFKERYPEMFREYKRECDAQRITPGHLHVWKTLHGDWIINFPTKRDWREKSRYEDVEAGLVALRRYLESQGKVTVALPALGCGHGGLDWARVSELIRKYLDNLVAKISVYEPKDSRAIGDKVRQKAQEATPAELESAAIRVIDADNLYYPEGLKELSRPTVFCRGVVELLSARLVSLLPSFKPMDREISASIALVELLAREKSSFSIPFSGKVALAAIQTAVSAGAKVLAWMPQGLLSDRLPGWLEDFVLDGKVTIASVSPPKMRWTTDAGKQAADSAAATAEAVVVGDPEPFWIERAKWRSRHELAHSLFYIRYGGQSDRVDQLWKKVKARGISKRMSTGTPDVQPILAAANHTPLKNEATVKENGHMPTPAAQPSDVLFENTIEGQVKKKTRRTAKSPSETEHLPPNLGKPIVVKTPDFSDPQRPKTCLEVDFPLVPINALSALEGNAGKPIYQMSKWWARRRSCVFRALLLAAAMEAPVKRHPDGQPMLGPDGKPLVDEDAAAQAVWDAYYANHQPAGNFKHLKVLDPFMGGGTTLVEGSRLGFQVSGVDLNPVAWFIVKNELACTDPAEVKAFFDQIEAEVKPQIQPFYVTDGVGGRKGVWHKIAADGSREKMPVEFDPTALPPAERKHYQYEGPEVIYTFWAKHGPCSNLGCGHRTPIFRSPVVAIKELGVKYIQCTCKNCKTVFHAELGDARIAPDAEHVVLENEHPYTVLSQGFSKRLMEYGEGGKGDKQFRVGELSAMVETEPGFNCPRCKEWSGQMIRDVLAMHRRAVRVSDVDKKHLGILPPRNGKKTIFCTLLIDPEWLKGSPGKLDGVELGGYIDAPIDATEAWYRERMKNLRLIEVRGKADVAVQIGAEETEEAEATLPPTIRLADGREINTKMETIARKANGKENDGHFVCAAPAGGHPVQFNKAVQSFGHTAPAAPYAIQCYDAKRDTEGHPYGGRYFKAPDSTDIKRLIDAEREWFTRKDADLNGFWPREDIPKTYMTNQANFALQEVGITHWYCLFDPLQLIVHATLLKAMTTLTRKQDLREQALGAFQQFLRMLNNQGFWNLGFDKMNPFFSNANYYVKSRIVTTSPFGALGYGRWPSCAEKVIEGLQWTRHPWECAVPEENQAAKSDKLFPNDPVLPGADLQCHSSSEMSFNGTIDLVITDPPFGDNLFYSDLADFFHCWLRLPLRGQYPAIYSSLKTPNAQEALKPRALPDAEGDQHYYDRLTPCWVNAYQAMKDAGIMAFTFHHSEDGQWDIVLRSLFDAKFYIEATFPITSDEKRGKSGEFGAKGTEYDIIHVCRKRLEEPRPVSWPKMRQWVKGELLRLRPLLESFKNRGLSDADIRVILRGKALEFYSRHYGKVLVSAPGGEETTLSIREALSGINQLLDESSGQPGERPPSIVQPKVYQFLRLFGGKIALGRDDVSKLLRGTAIQQRDFERGGFSPWVIEADKVVTRVPIYDRFQKMRQRSRLELKTELDQAHFLIGAALPVKEGDGGVNIEKELERDTFLIRPGVEALLDWYAKTPAGADEPGVPRAAGVALQLLRAAFEAKRAHMKIEQRTLWDEWEAVEGVSA